MRSASRVCCWVTVLCAGAAVVACGYRSSGTTIARAEVYVAWPDPSRVDDPLLAVDLRSELIRQLGRRGVSIATRARGTTTMHTRLIELTGADVALRGRWVATERLRLVLEGWLIGRDGNTLWRSGRIEVARPFPQSGGIAAAEAARRTAVRALAQDAAARLADLLP